MAELSKAWHFLFWNKLRGRVTRAKAWKQYEVSREFIISNWFSMLCCKHTPGYILKIFSCKSSGIELSQTGWGPPWVEWWNSGCVFLAPFSHLYPHTPSMPSVFLLAESESISLYRNVGTWKSLRAERGWEKAIIPANSPPFASCQKEVMSPPGSLPPCQLPFYQGALQFFKELLKTHNFFRLQWRNFSRYHSSHCDKQCVESILSQYIDNLAQNLLLSFPVLKISLGDRKQS